MEERILKNTVGHEYYTPEGDIYIPKETALIAMRSFADYKLKSTIMKTKNYSITWRHGIAAKGFSSVTVCNVKQDGRVIGGAMSRVHPNDTYCKDKGRRVSLARWMECARLPKEERAVIWEAYRNMKPSGRWPNAKNNTNNQN